MANAKHSEQNPADGIHLIQAFEPADTAALAALVVVAADIGRVARQLDTEDFYVLTDTGPSVWTILTNGMTDDYTPDESDNWEPVPTTFPAALDTLALRGSFWQWGNAGVATSTTTRYLDWGVHSLGPAPTGEGETQFEVERIGAITTFAVRHGIAGAVGGGSSIVYTLRLNGGDTTLTVTIAADSTTQVASTGSIDVVAGDLLSISAAKASAIATSPAKIKAFAQVN